MGKEKRGGSRSVLRARKARRRLLRVLLFGGIALGLGGVVGGLTHLGMYGVPGITVSASPGASPTAPDPSHERDAEERARDWNRSILLKLQPVLDERRRTPASGMAVLPGSFGEPEAIARGDELVAILRADPKQGSWKEIAAGAGLYLELLAWLPEPGAPGRSIRALVAEAKKAGPKAVLPGAIGALGEAVSAPSGSRWDSFTQSLLGVDDGLSSLPGSGETRETVRIRLDMLLQCWLLARGQQAPAATRSAGEARKRVLELLPRAMPGKRSDGAPVEDRGRLSWRTRVLLELVEESLGVDEKEGTASFAQGAMATWVGGEKGDDPVLVAATAALVQALLTFEEGAVDPADIEIWAEHLKKLRGRNGALSRLKLGLTRLWMRKVLDKLEEEAQSVSLLKPWTAAKLISSGQSFLDTTSLIAREFPEEIGADDWVAIYDTGDRGLSFLQSIATSHSQFLPPGARRGVTGFERRLEESQSSWSNEKDPLRYLLASCLRLTLRGRVPQLLEPGPAVGGDQVQRLVTTLEGWATKEWLATPAGAAVRHRLLSLARFLDPADPARAGLEKSLSDPAASSR